MTKTSRFLPAAVLALALLVPTLAAAQCPIGTCTAGTFFFDPVKTYCCDQICNGGPCNYNFASMAACDFNGTPSNPGTPDGACVICNGAGQNSTINGSSLGEVICGGDGNDIIDGKNGNDIIDGGAGDDVIQGGSGNDFITGGAGLDSIEGEADNDSIADVSSNVEPTMADGGNGNDQMWMSGSDDDLIGGSGNDLIIGQGGADHIDGGGGDDVLSTVVIGQTSIQDDALGATYCGGTGNDTLIARGPGHHCMDGGADTDVCDYAFFVTSRAQVPQDIGTALNCETTSGVSTTRFPECACN